MLGPILSIARNTFTEAIRQPIYVILMLLVGLLFILGVTTSAYTFGDDTMQMVVMGLGMILIGGAWTAALVSSGVLNREIENKTALTVISKPIGRPVFVVGKYLGVAGALGLLMWVWSLVFLLTVRHKVISSSGDDLDMPVIVFGLSAVVLAGAVAVWGNYFYRWVFTSTFVRVLAVTLSIAYLLVLLINKHWEFQSIITEFDPDLAPVTNYGEEKKSLVQVVITIALVYQAVWIIAAVAIAASTRLGQVMTLMTCLGVAAIGATSDGLFGQYAGQNIVANVLYHITPNFQFFYLGDALTQNSTISGQYIGLASVYAGAWIIAILSLAVALFQTRETG